MKRIEAVIPSDKLEEVKEVIKNTGAGGFLVLTGKGQGQRKRFEEPSSMTVEPHIGGYNTVESVMTVVDDAKAEGLVSAIVNAACTDCKGDGKVFVSTVDEVRDIGSKNKGSKAL